VGASAPAPLPYTAVRVFYATDRAPGDATEPGDRFTGRRRPTDGFELGAAVVTIPKDHRLAELESPSIWRLELAEDPARHVVLASVTTQSREEFHAEVRQRVAGSVRREALVYVHGFLTSWEDSLRVTAQLAYDLQFDGAPIVYSWPAGERLSSYSEAATSAEWATPHLAAFLGELRHRIGASSVHLVAHSMGNRLVTRALQQLALRDPNRQPLFNQIVLAAPDVDAAVFRQLAADVARAGRQVTLYASSNDQALKVSMRMHAYPRAGLSGEGLVVVPGIDTIDVSEVDTSLLGHFYYQEATSVVTDLHALIKSWAPAAQRRHLRPFGDGARRFWRVQRGLAPSPP
jgi:esterase/lipase superfamily enzyme